MEERNAINIACSICNDQIAIYRCPACLARTCSLTCCITHKEQSGCDGKRNRVAYVPLHKFNDSTLSSDYHFLEDVLAKSGCGKRLMKDIGASVMSPKKQSSRNKRRKLNDTPCDENEDKDESSQCLPIQPLLSLKVDDESEARNVESTKTFTTSLAHSNNNIKSNPILNSNKHDNNLANIKSSMEKDNLISNYPPHKQKLVNQAHQRGIRLLLMAPGMQRHIMNKSTKYDIKKNIINWKVEFIIHSFPPKKVNDANDSNLKGTKNLNQNEKSTKIVLTSDRIPECDSLYGHLSKLFERNISHAAPALTRSTVLHFCNSLHKNIIKDNVCALMKRIPCKSSQPTYRRVNLNSCLNEILKGTTIIEFPTVEIVKEEDLGHFPVFIEELM